MDSHLLAFLLGFFACAAGVFITLLFDVGMSRLEAFFKRLF